MNFANLCVTICRRMAVVLLAGIVAVLPLQGLVWASSVANTWVDGDAPRLEVGGQVQDPTPVSCFPASFTYHSYTNADGSFNSIGRDVEKGVCTTQNSLGFFGNSSGSTNPFAYDFIKPNTANAFRVLNSSGNPVGLNLVPGQQTFFFGTSDGNLNGGRSLRFYDNLSSIGTFTAQFGNVNELVFKLNPIVAMIAPLKDSAGNIIHMMDAYAFSPNGEWMLVEADNLGLIRINTQTRQMQLISNEYYTYGQGFRPQMTLAISDDGNSAIRSGFNTLNTTTYDLSGCQPTPFVRSSANNTTPGCRSRSVQADLAQQYSGFRGFVQMRFNGDGNSVTGVLSKDTPTGAREYYATTYSIAGYVPTHLSYLALGDSFSSGEGARNYEIGTDNSDPRNKCHLSTKSYPYLAAEALGVGGSFHSVACSGAKSENYLLQQKDQNEVLTSPLLKWLPGYQGQKKYFKAAGSTSVVTLSMIGNDIGFSNKIIRCIAATDPCFHFREDRESIAYEIYNKFDTLVDLYKNVQTDSNGAKVYVLGYPQLVSTGADCGLNISLDAEERQMARGLTTYLNAVIKAATEKAGVQYIDAEDAFAGHELCDPGAKAVNGLTAGNDTILDIGPIGNESFHPNELGHQLLSQALLAQSQNFSKAMPAAIPAKAAPYVGSTPYNALIGSAPSGGVYTRATYTALNGLDVVVEAVPFLPDQAEQYLKPSSAFEVWLNSTPVHVGTLSTDAEGRLTGQVTVPQSVPPGFHTMHIYGQNIAGEAVDLYKTIYVAASENDIDGDGTPNSKEKCLAVEPAGVDQDRDGIDDACDPEISELPADVTPPEVTGTPDRQPNAADWYNNDVTINWVATDPAPSSGPPTTPPAAIATQEGMHIYTSGQSCDPLNNCAAGSLQLKIDKTSPDITYTLSPAPSVTGWHNSAVTITFACSDAASDIATCAEPQTVSAADGMYAVAGTATDKAGNSTGVNIFVSLDSTKPTVKNTVSPAANAAGWHNSDVTITPVCADNLSGLAFCSPVTTLTSEGVSQTVTSTATDNAGNNASATTGVNIDKTAPVLGGPAWTNNPKPTAGTATLQIVATDNLSGLAAAEYFLGDTDPGQGNGATVTIAGDTLTTTFNTDFPTGVYKVTVRAKDRAGNWSAGVSDYLVVYNPDGVRMTGKKTLLPSLANGDILPGLITNTQTDKAKFGFNVRYDNQGNIHPNSDFQFSYATGTKCNKPAQAQNCHSLELNATSIAWLATQGANNSTGIFQGTATLTADGATSPVVFRLTGLDGERLDPASDDHLILKIYAGNANPNTAQPLYQVGDDVLRGNIKIRTL